MENEIDWMHMEKIYGVIVIKVGVDTNGKPCTISIINRTTAEDEVLGMMDFHKIISRMPKWKPALNEGRKVASSVPIAIYCRVEKHPVFQVGYLRDDKEKTWKVKNGNKVLIYLDDKAKIPE